jgi:predicted transcriptional regulator
VGKRARFKSLKAFVASFPERHGRQREVAQVLGLTEPALSSYLSGRLVPSRETALRLSRDHDIDLSGLLDPSSAEIESRAS